MILLFKKIAFMSIGMLIASNSYTMSNDDKKELIIMLHNEGFVQKESFFKKTAFYAAIAGTVSFGVYCAVRYIIKFPTYRQGELLKEQCIKLSGNITTAYGRTLSLQHKLGDASTVMEQARIDFAKLVNQGDSVFKETKKSAQDLEDVTNDSAEIPPLIDQSAMRLVCLRQIITNNPTLAQHTFKDFPELERLRQAIVLSHTSKQNIDDNNEEILKRLKKLAES